jgi:hypothetical protein
MEDLFNQPMNFGGGGQQQMPPQQQPPQQPNLGPTGAMGVPSYEELSNMSPEELAALPPEALQAFMEYSKQQAAAEEAQARQIEAEQRQQSQAMQKMGMTAGQGAQAQPVPNMASMGGNASSNMSQLMGMRGRQQPQRQKQPRQQVPQNAYIQSLLGG